jgi:serine/threonine-protein kinase
MQCPDPAVLQAFYDGRIEGSELDTLISHVEACERCITVLDAFQGNKPEVHLAAEEPPTTDSGSSSRVPHRCESSSSRYQVLRSHARGGLGEIFLAVDHELHREVALKRVHQRFARHSEARTRFIREAEVTGGLEHPGIAPVYSLGVDAEGFHYYTMRFIRGESLRDAVKKFHAGAENRRMAAAIQSVEFRKLVQRLIEVCNVIAFAHSRKILHRDIKPANVMLGRYGETLVVDWGLARPIGEVETPSESSLGPLVTVDGEVSLTRDGTVVGTPAYMSPEQAAGRLNEASARSDIYSLGATLYTILTGRPPFVENNVARLLEQVVQGDFPPPRKLQPFAPRRLEAICLKAMATHPAERYASCEALVDDLEHYLANEPVSALPDTLTARVFRWVTRHRTLVTSGAAAVAVAVVVLSIASVLLATANHDLVQTNLREQAATQKAQQAFANEQAATQRAQQTYQLAKKALDDVVKLREDPRFQAGPLEDVRLQLQQAESGFYEKFAELNGDDPFFQFERAKAITELARLRARFSSGGQTISELKAAAEILASEYSQSQSKLPLAECHHSLANAYRNAGRNELAIPEYERSIAVLRQLMQEFPKISDYPNRLCRVQKNLAGSLDTLGRHAEAGKLLLETMDTRQALLAAEPDSERLQNDLASTYRELGSHYLSYLKSPANSEPYLTKAEVMYEALLERNPENEEYQSNLATCLVYLASAAQQRKSDSDTETAWLKAISLYERLAAAHPKIMGYKLYLASYYARLGNHYHPLPKSEEQAIEAYQNALRAIESVDAKEIGRVLPLLAATRVNLSNVFARLGKIAEHDEQEALLERDLARIDDIKFNSDAAGNGESEPDASEGKRLVVTATALAALYIQRAGFRARRGQWNEAAADGLRATEIEPQRHWNGYVAGYALVLAGDIDKFHKLCRDMQQRFGNTADPVLAERTGKLCLLTPQPDLLESADRLTQLALSKGGNHQFVGWFRLARGLAAYRQGRLEEAIQILSNLEPLAKTSPAMAGGNLIAALAKARLTQGKEQLQQLKQAAAWGDTHPCLQFGYDLDWQLFEIMRREALPLLQAAGE